jgi:hypothetical protein
MGTAVGLLFNQLSPKAFAKLPWQYYAVFVGCDALAALSFFTIYPETKGKTLEEIAELFGDTIAYTERIGNGAGDAKDIEDKSGAEDYTVQHSEHQDNGGHVEDSAPKSTTVGATTTTETAD